MERPLQGLLVVRGALVLLAGFVAGFPCGSTVVASLGPEAPAPVAP